MSDRLEPSTPAEERKRIIRSRNRVVGILLLAFVVLVYAISIAKMN